MQISFIALSLTFFFARGYIRDDCFCGISNSEFRRITMGVVTEPFKYPWMVLIFSANKKPYCGGALISDRHVLTAAHCFSFNPSQPDFWLDVYGKVKSHDSQLGDSMNFNKIFIHPKYRRGEQYDDFDLAIVSFRKPLQELNGKIRPICVPQTRQYYGGKKAVISGWGTVNENVLKMSRYLREGNIEILHPKKCPAATNMHKLYNFESMICAFSAKHVDTCQGDSGGPLFVETKHFMFDIVGVASFGDKCGGVHAGVYADVTQALPWVWSIINSTGVCPRLTSR